MGFAAGFNAGSGLVQRAQEAKENRERWEAEQAYKKAEFEQRQLEWNRTNARAREEDAAFSDMAGMLRGVVTQGTGLSQPSGQMLYHNGYGGATGAAAVRDAAGDMNREQARMGLQRTVDPTAAVRTRPATDLEINQAAQRVALANRDLGAWSNIEGNSRALRVSDARKAELKRLNGMNYAELVGVFQESINDNPGVPAMVDFDPETRKYLVVSKVPGVPTQSLSRAEMLQSMMGLWEAGNGDYNAGIQAVVAGAKGQREIQDKNFERSRTMAQGNAGLYFEGRKADNDDKRTANDSARLGLARQEAKRRAEMEKMAGGRVRQYEDKDGNIVERFEVMTPQGLDSREMPVPAGLRPYNPKGQSAEVKLPEDGTRVRDARSGQVLTYAEGVPLLAGGIPPSQRENKFAQLDLPAAAERLVEWAPTGRHLRTKDGMAYDITSRSDMDALRKRIELGEMGELTSREVEAGGLRTDARRTPKAPLQSANEWVLRRQAEVLPRPLSQR